MNGNGVLATHRVHVIQTVVILIGVLIPTFGSMVWIYSTMHADVAQALRENVRQDTDIAEIRKEEREFAIEQRSAWGRTNDILTKVQVDTATNAAAAAATAAAVISGRKR